MVLAPEVGSFRDPAGTLIRRGDRILRLVNSSGLADTEAFLISETARGALADGRLVRTVRIAPEEAPPEARAAAGVFEHERIPFPSYPYEWPPEMLHAAGALTLELAREALTEGFGLKDATPYNVLFRGPRPVFIDLLSFERRDPLEATWMPYGQFTRTFLLPLVAQRKFGLTLDRVLAGQRDGLEPEIVYRWASWWQRLTPPFLSLVSLPTWLAGVGANDPSRYHPKPASSPDQASFILRGILNGCGRTLARLEPRATQSTWTGYLDTKSIYNAEQFAAKEEFVRRAIAESAPRAVLDAGANEGHFSFLAARGGASVVAIDSDPAVIGRVWRRARTENADVLPLVVDLTRPTPALGWRNQECASFLDRARGGFDLVLMLAVVHHMLVTERVPLDQIVDLAAELTREYALIEFVAPQDPMFGRLVRGREALYSHLNHSLFEASTQSRFELVNSLAIPGLHRWLYLFRKRRA